MCGVIGITIPAETLTDLDPDAISESRVAYEIYHGLLTLQHRGQDAAGIATFDHKKKKISHHKSHGLVSEVFSSEKLDLLTGYTAIGHTRYQTIKGQTLNDVQPMVTGFPTGMALAHNGHIDNYEQLIKNLANTFGIQTLSSNDAELFQYYFSLYFANKTRLTPLTPSVNELKFVCHDFMKKAQGGYALLAMFSNGCLMGLRDPNGLRPLVLGEKIINNIKSYCLSSETVAMQLLGYDIVRDIKPGELIVINKCGEIYSEVIYKKVKLKPCMFEWVYFSGSESTLENRSVYQTRLALGKQMKKHIQKAILADKINPDIVIPVPDTSRTAAIALAEALNLPYREALVKNRYIYRSFILSDQAKREKAVEIKLLPVISEIKGRSVLLVDDSIVRGTTSRRIVSLLKRHGAKAVYIAVTSPPIRYPCFYGIDLPNKKELIANNEKTNVEISKEIGADAVYYLTSADLKSAIDLPDFCQACITGKYPTPVQFKVPREQCSQNEVIKSENLEETI